MTEGPSKFDCFLSHNSRDKSQARHLAEQLRAAGLSVWLDEEHLPLGRPWQPELEAAIRGARAVLVLIGAHGLGPWEHKEMRMAVNLATQIEMPVIPVLASNAPPSSELPAFLLDLTGVDLRPKSESDAPSGLDRLIQGLKSASGDGAPASRCRPELQDDHAALKAAYAEEKQRLLAGQDVTEIRQHVLAL